MPIANHRRSAAVIAALVLPMAAPGAEPIVCHGATEELTFAALTEVEQTGRIRLSRVLSEQFAACANEPGLREVFGKLLADPDALDPGDRYLALLDYADGLAAFGAPDAWTAFESALAAAPDGNHEALNRYARRLLDQGLAREALAVLERLTPEQRIRHVVPAQLRRQALLALGMDTADADAEISALKRRTPRFGTRP